MLRAAIVLSLGLVACAVTGAPFVTPDAAAKSPVWALHGPCPALPNEVGRVEDSRLNEISGIVESHLTPGVFFVHNDSGDSPRFFALDRAGQVLAELALETVPSLIDAEDIALGPGPGGASFVYLGDTGNNFASFGVGIPRRKAVIYRVPEPHVPPAARNLKVPLRDAFPIVLSFPSGARDVEAFFVDPVSGALFMIGKQPDGQSQVLSASPELLMAGGGELHVEGELRFGREPLPGSPMPTAASISGNGSAILVRTYSSVFLFRRRADESVMSALGRAPARLPSPREQQGEAVGFAEQDSAFVTISEGVKPAVHCASIAPQ
jgi:hypothetical protein